MLNVFILYLKLINKLDKKQINKLNILPGVLQLKVKHVSTGVLFIYKSFILRLFIKRQFYIILIYFL